MKREGLIKQMAEEKRPWDLLIIGGGATGLIPSRMGIMTSRFV